VLGSAPEPPPARRRVLTGVWARAAIAAAVVLVAVAVATGGPSRDVVVRPTDSSTVATATTPPADQADPTPRRHHPVRPSAGPRTHRARTPHGANTSTMSDHTASAQTASVRTSTPAAGGEEDGSETKGTALPEESGDDRGIDGASGTEAGGGATFDEGTATTDSGEMFDGAGGDGGETPDGVDD
jgi:hypothetical protein